TRLARTARERPLRDHRRRRRQDRERGPVAAGQSPADQPSPGRVATRDRADPADAFRLTRRTPVIGLTASQTALPKRRSRVAYAAAPAAPLSPCPRLPRRTTAVRAGLRAERL